MNQTTDIPSLQYGAAKDRILRTLLMPGLEPPSWYRIAKTAGASYPWTHALLTNLEDHGLIERTRVVRPFKLFEKWASEAKPLLGHEFLVQHPERLFGKRERTYAWTTYWAENLVQRHLYPRRLDFYTTLEARNKWRQTLADEGLIGGGNVRLLVGDAHILATSRTVKGKLVVSVPQLILDLLREGGPCREAAELLIRKEYHATD